MIDIWGIESTRESKGYIQFLGILEVFYEQYLPWKTVYYIRIAYSCM